jgi:hypothetical protein
LWHAGIDKNFIFLKMLQIKNKNLPRTVIELYETLPESIMCEVIHNGLRVNTAPGFLNQVTSKHLLKAFSRFEDVYDSGISVAAPVDVYINDTSVLQPDIIFIAKERLDIIKKGRVKGVPDLVVEIVSPGTRKHDTAIKKDIYEKAGVKEYFIVNPETKQVMAYWLRHKKFVKQPNAKAKLNSRLLGQVFEF